MTIPIRRMLALAIVSLAFLPASSPAQTADPDALAQEFIRAWNAHDAEALGRLFSDEIDWVTVNGTWEQGPRKIQAQMKEAHATYFKNATLSVKRTRTRLLQPDVAVIHLAWEVTGVLDRRGRARGPRTGIISLVANRQAGGWKIAAAQNTYTSPPEAQEVPTSRQTGSD